MIIIVICQAAIGWRLPAISRSRFALIAINAVFFHVLPTVRFGVYSPRTVTTILLYLPVAWLVYRGVRQDGVLTRAALIGSVLIN